MSRTTRLLAVAATLTFTGGSFADTLVEDQNEQLRTRIAELEDRLANVEAQGNDNWLTERRAQEIRSVVEDVLADADTRSSMLAQGMTAGYDDGAVIASADGNWLLRTNLLLQTRFMLRNQDSRGSFDGTVWGFEVTRARFSLTGNVVSPEWFYRVDIETSSLADASVSTGTGLVKPDSREGLLDAYVGYDFGNGWKLLGGNMRVPLLYEDLMEAQYQQAVERSVLTYQFTGGYSTGIAVDYSGDQFRVRAMWNNGVSDGLYGGAVADVGGGGPPGAGTINTGALTADTRFAITARGEWLAMGTWDQFMDYTSPQGEEMAVLVGTAIHWQSSEHPNSPPGGSSLPDVDLFTLAIDASAEFGGANVYGAVIFNSVHGAGSTGSPFGGNPWGFQLGGGWYFTEVWELFGRYEYTDYDELFPDDMSIITFGVNRYFAGHHAKWTTDFGFATDANSVSIPVTGWHDDFISTDPGGKEDGQFVIRTQLQILF